VNNAGGVALYFALVPAYEHVPQAASIDAFGKWRLTATQVMECRQKVPLHDRYVALRTRFDSRAGNDGRRSDSALKDGAFSFLKRAAGGVNFARRP